MIADYMNGNVHVTLDDDGTRIMEVPDDEEFNFEYPVNIDINISENCDGGCSFCYQRCTPDGKHAELLNEPLFDTILPGTEIAIPLNKMNHPQLIPFLNKMKKRGVVVNGTINQIHFMKYHKLLQKLCDRKFLHGIGISLRKPTEEFINLVKTFPNAIIHVINGIVTADDIEMLRDRGLKILILGYKDIGRGIKYKKENEVNLKARQKYLYNVLQTLQNHFETISFDNNALAQLDARRLIPEDKWDEFYQGDEGTLSMYIDLVNRKFGISSTEPPENMMLLTDDVKEMFEIVKRRAA